MRQVFARPPGVGPAIQRNDTSVSVIETAYHCGDVSGYVGEIEVRDENGISTVEFEATVKSETGIVRVTRIYDSDRKEARVCVNTCGHTFLFQQGEAIALANLLRIASGRY